MKTELKILEPVKPNYELILHMTHEEALDLRRLVAYMILDGKTPGSKLFNRIYNILEDNNIEWRGKEVNLSDNQIRF